MKFNPDCMRDILFYLEENLTFSSDLESEPICVNELDKNLSYTIQEITNMLLIMNDAGFISVSKFGSNNRISELNVNRITYNGYQLIESIRPKPVWEKVLTIGQKVGSFSINVISQISSEVLTSMINSLNKKV